VDQSHDARKDIALGKLFLHERPQPTEIAKSLYTRNYTFHATSAKVTNHGNFIRFAV